MKVIRAKALVSKQIKCFIKVEARPREGETEARGKEGRSRDRQILRD